MLKFKKITIAVALMTGLGFSFSSTAQSDVNEALQNICTIVKADDKSELRNKMKKVQSDYRLKLRDYYSGITCSGKSLVKTSFENDAVEAGTLLIKKLPKKALRTPEHDNQGTLLEWATANGKNSQLIEQLKDRIE